MRSQKALPAPCAIAPGTNKCPKCEKAHKACERDHISFEIWLRSKWRRSRSLRVLTVIFGSSPAAWPGSCDS